MSLSARLRVAVRRCSSLDSASQTAKQITRYASTFNARDNDNYIQKSVFISQSTNVFVNLALEHWLYRNFDFSKHHVLLFWRNDPCVVFGRHQNPWLECNVQTSEKAGIALARRNSGGGTVYHDNGNLNLTFFTPRERYNRRYNLNIITNALFRQWGLKSEINKREDIVVNEDCKISGTAAKLGKPNAYHHCTLLVNVNKANLSSILERKENGIVTNATTSIRSPIMNLIDINQNIQMDKLLSAIGWEYLRTKALTLEDGRYDLVEQQKGFKFINPTEDWFPGIDNFTSEFRSWDWNFGRTPKFMVTRTLDFPAHDGKIYRLNLSLEVQNGFVEEIRMSLPADLVSTDFAQDASVISNIRGTKYNHDVTENIIAAIGGKTATVNTTQSVDENNMRLDEVTLQ
ncbi:PREDICTED: lipoyltransferase 1, mitochondrial isoform X2 [Cyphomyrmex costatus]|uniref:Lipoyltransferase 1, mitochondrial n=1 Tax=Cyphomyrmex costatus TaxID=456900 RepID=A0A195C4R7_9HYME|nr:PREDICTED: lipoyltransferase 1, mitochondrial isoform X2 [Cyphomyrmex costatus]KYM95171.1 Lipoyltransferase 1, mitochondrial [Cyphomyrmex costatus]